ncbi:hypothetical protein ED733_002258 [Metarhizium rileyi]|uniref:Uncharacterized protein n=1 Tax=Metarhizium rileyi (strain RCEF 4871) TaxID=1649241 RepID=A0A5C6G7E4_METRR|nr:hypothetical protein ED733_002258 [Metarhizium rileyi]
MEVFALHSLFKEIPKRINVQSLDEKYVLAHPDLRCGNIIVTGDLHILGIIDWEFTSAIPLQLFTPPSWIMGHDPSTMRIATGIHRDSVFPEFCAVLKEMCRTSVACTQLWHDWGLEDERHLQDNKMKDISPLMQIFRQPCSLIQVYYSSIFPKLFGLEARKDTVINEFFAEDKNLELSEQVEDQIQTSRRYTDYLRNNNLLVEDDRLRLIQDFLDKTKFLVEGDQT